MRRGFGTAVVVAAVAAGGSAQGQALRYDRERVLAIDMRVERFSPRRSPTATGAGTAWVVNLPPLVRGVPRIRLHFDIVQAGVPESWRVRVKDLAGTTLQEIAGADAAPLGPGFWTDELPAAQARVELSWDGRGAPPVLEASRYAYTVGSATPQSTVGVDQRQPIATAPARHQALGPAVARLRIMTEDGQGYCTGFLLGKDLLMTNEHCVRTAAEAASVLVDFRYDAPGAKPDVVRGAGLLRTSSDLDYTLLRLSRPVAAALGRLYLESAAVRDGQELVIIQHPGGEPKQVSIADCVVAGLGRPGASPAPTDFGHECDTLGGSSGSPVLDRATGRVVGLHHFGFRVGLEEPVNQAVQVGPILADLSTGVGAVVLDEVRQAPPP